MIKDFFPGRSSTNEDKIMKKWKNFVKNISFDKLKCKREIEKKYNNLKQWQREWRDKNVSRWISK